MRCMESMRMNHPELFSDGDELIEEVERLAPPSGHALAGGAALFGAGRELLRPGQLPRGVLHRAQGLDPRLHEVDRKCAERLHPGWWMVGVDPLRGMTAAVLVPEIR